MDHRTWVLASGGSFLLDTSTYRVGNEETPNPLVLRNILRNINAPITSFGFQRRLIFLKCI